MLAAPNLTCQSASSFATEVTETRRIPYENKSRINIRGSRLIKQKSLFSSIFSHHKGLYLQEKYHSIFPVALCASFLKFNNWLWVTVTFHSESQLVGTQLTYQCKKKKLAPFNVLCCQGQSSKPDNYINNTEAFISLYNTAMTVFQPSLLKISAFEGYMCEETHCLLLLHHHQHQHFSLPPASQPWPSPPSHAYSQAVCRREKVKPSTALHAGPRPGAQGWVTNRIKFRRCTCLYINK